MENDESWYPTTKSLYDQMEEFTKLGRLKFPWAMFAYPFYLFKRSPGKTGSHFDPSCDLFQPSERRMVLTSNAFLVAMVGVLAAATAQLGVGAMLALYFVPYCERGGRAGGRLRAPARAGRRGCQGRARYGAPPAPSARAPPRPRAAHARAAPPPPPPPAAGVFVAWLDMVTYLQHHGSEPGEQLPWYRGGAWSYLRGGLTCMDREYGAFHWLTHNIGTHVVHHLFERVRLGAARRAGAALWARAPGGGPGRRRAGGACAGGAAVSSARQPAQARPPAPRAPQTPSPRPRQVPHYHLREATAAAKGVLGCVRAARRCTPFPPPPRPAALAWAATRPRTRPLTRSNPPSPPPPPPRRSPYYREPVPCPAHGVPTQLVEPLLRSFREDHYVEDAGEVVFYQQDPSFK